jgi:hypothetical protein
MNFKSLAVGIIITLFLTNCRKDDILPFSSWYTSGTNTIIIRNAPTNINRMKPVVTASDKALTPILPQVIRFATQRNGTNNVPILTTLNGVLLSQIPEFISTLFTRGNRPLSEIGGDSTYVARGWNIDSVYYIDVNASGVTLNVTTSLTGIRASALSITITFYPDGYYTFINNQNPVNNQMGWYQLAVVDNFPIGIIYQALHSGVDFKSPPQLASSPLQSFGIWGVDDDKYFFPLLQLDKKNNIFLRMVPISY